MADRRGVTTLIFAGTSGVIIGAAALATDASIWYVAKRNAQSAADAAAAAGAVTRRAVGDTAATTNAIAAARQNGFTNGNGTTIAVNFNFVAPSPVAGDTSATEVTITQTQRAFFAGYFGIRAPVVRARAIARFRESTNVCALTLVGSLSINGSAEVNADKCSLASNKRGADSVVIGSGTLNASSLNMAGTCTGCYTDTGTLVSNLKLASPPRTLAPQTPDPLSALRGTNWDSAACAPALQGNSTDYKPIESFATPTVICGNMTFTGNASTVLTPGTYVIRGGDLSIGGNVDVTCNGCTFVLVQGKNDKGAETAAGSIKINGSGSTNNDRGFVDFRAPTSESNPFRGVVFYRDSRATDTTPTVTINGARSSIIQGAMYFPTSIARVTGNASTAGCSLLLAHTLTFSGNASSNMCKDLYNLTVPVQRSLEFVL